MTKCDPGYCFSFPIDICVSVQSCITLPVLECRYKILLYSLSQDSNACIRQGVFLTDLGNTWLCA